MRYNATSEGNIPFTSEEELEANIKESEWIAQAPLRQQQENKEKAASLLSATDWTQVADVPLLNKQAFTDYRAAVRAIALNPPVQATFPDLPAEQW
jgi:hypothetical protein